MGNQQGMETEETVRQRYDHITKAHSYSEVLLSFSEAKEQFHQNSHYLDKYTVNELEKEAYSAENGDDEDRLSFRLNVFTALTNCSDVPLKKEVPVVEVQTAIGLLPKVKQFVYVRAYLSPEGSQEKAFWSDILNTQGADNIYEKLNAWDRNWRQLVH